jgi:hypothetical protein
MIYDWKGTSSRTVCWLLCIIYERSSRIAFGLDPV